MLLKTHNLSSYSRDDVETKAVILLIALILALSASSCSGSGNPSPSNAALAAPVFSTTAAQNGAVILAISTGSGAAVHYTFDGSTPTASSPAYQAPMLISTNLTIHAIATAPGAAWPFDSGNAQYLIVNLAVGGSWPGNPTSSTPFPSQTLVDYVRVYAVAQ